MGSRAVFFGRGRRREYTSALIIPEAILPYVEWSFHKNSDSAVLVNQTGATLLSGGA